MLKILEQIWDGIKVVSPGIEVLVFLLIAYEVYVGVKERKTERRRADIVEKRVAAMRELMSKGQALLASQPSWHPPGPLDRWVQETKEWTEEVRALLRSYSSQAEAVFLHHPTIVPNFYGGNPKPFDFGALEHRLSNLRNIMEKPDVYL